MTGRAADVTKITPRTGYATGFDGSSITCPENLYGNPAPDRQGATWALARAAQRWHDVTDLASNARFNHMTSHAFPAMSERVAHVRIAAPEMAA